MNEKELIQKCLEGQEEACALLVQQHQPIVFRHCMAIVKDEAMAQDMTQETFVHVFQHLPSFRMESKFSTWLWRITHNLCLNYIKKHQLREQELHEEHLSAPLLEKDEVDEERVVHIEEAMKSLSLKLRVVFEMYDIQHIPQKEIAATLGIPYGTVRSRLHSARQKIRSKLA